MFRKLSLEQHCSQRGDKRERGILSNWGDWGKLGETERE